MLLRLLGTVEVNTPNGWIRAGRPQQCCVVASLALSANKAVTNDVLARNVWGDRAPKSARNAIHGHVTRIRGLLAGHSEASLKRASSDGYRLDLPAQRIDVFAMRRYVMGALSASEAGDPRQALRRWRAAESLWREPALTGVGGDWARQLRDKLERERLNVLKGRFDAQLELGQHEAIIDELTDLVFDHPLAEPLIAQLMTAQFRSGLVNDAVLTFSQARHHAREELGTEPGASLSQLHQRILRRDRPGASDERPRTSPAAGSGLPPAPKVFLGRDGELRALTRQLCSSRASSPVTVVSGMAGVGKTALALRAAHQIADAFPDGCLHINLHGFSEDEPALSTAAALSRLLRGLGVPDHRVPDDTEERAALYRGVLADKRALIVLDDAVDEEQVEALLPGQGDCRALVTSRRRLPGIVDINTVRLDVLDSPAAVALFEVGCGPQDDAAATGQLVESCGRLPLAVVIAAARLKARSHWTVPMLRDRLMATRDRLAMLTLGRRSVAARFAASYERLPAQLRRLFRLLGMLPGPEFHTDAAAALMDECDEEVEWLLDDLTDDNMLRRTGPSRFALHDLLWQFARERAGAELDDAERRAAANRLERPTATSDTT